MMGSSQWISTVDSVMSWTETLRGGEGWDSKSTKVKIRFKRKFIDSKLDVRLRKKEQKLDLFLIFIGLFI